MLKYLWSPLLSFFLIFSGQQASASVVAPSSDYPLLEKHLFRIAGGRRLNLVCSGQGEPTVIFLAGFGSNLLGWQKVAEQASHISRSCFYDRAGYGYSDPSNSPSTSMSAVEDLHHLLKAAHIRMPVILVGHSLGGLHATLYADRYRSEVAGLVLIDPSFAGQNKEETAEEHVEDAKSNRNTIAGLEACAALARQGKLVTEPHTECFEYSPGRTSNEREMLSYAVTHPALYETQVSEMRSMYSTDGNSDVNSRQERVAKRSFGDIPLFVLTAPVAQEPNATPAQQARASEFWRSWKRGHDELATRSKRGRSILVSNTSHYIQIDQPSAVLSALRNVVQMARVPK